MLITNSRKKEFVLIIVSVALINSNNSENAVANICNFSVESSNDLVLKRDNF